MKAPVDTRTRRPELEALTGVRAVAAAMVVLSHIGLPERAPDWLRELVATGYVGVPLFFVLSGIVLAYNYSGIDPRDGRAVARFYVARAARVLPLYYAVLAYVAMLRGTRGQEQEGLWRHLLNIQAWDPQMHIAMGYNPPAWSINVELFFYLLFPLLMPLAMWLWRRWGPRGVLVAVGVLLALQWLLCLWFFATGWADLPATDPASGHRWLYRNPLPRLIEFGTGIGIALCIDTRALRALSTRGHSLLQVGMAAWALAATLLRPWEGDWAGLWRVASFGALYTLPFAVLLWSLASGRGVLARFLSTAPLRSLGVSSYAMYLTHRPFLDSFGASAIRTSDTWYGWAMVPLVLGFCMLLGEGAHRAFEQPIRRAIMRAYDAARGPSPGTAG